MTLIPKSDKDKQIHEKKKHRPVVGVKIDRKALSLSNTEVEFRLTSCQEYKCFRNTYKTIHVRQEITILSERRNMMMSIDP